MRGQVIGCISELTAFLLHVDSEVLVIQFEGPLPIAVQDQVSPFCVHDLSHGNMQHINHSPTHMKEFSI